MNKLFYFLGLYKKSQSNFSRFFHELGDDRMSSGEKKKVIREAIKAANQEQKDLVDRVEKSYSR